MLPTALHGHRRTGLPGSLAPRAKRPDFQLLNASTFFTSHCEGCRKQGALRLMHRIARWLELSRRPSHPQRPREGAAKRLRTGLVRRSNHVYGHRDVTVRGIAHRCANTEEAGLTGYPRAPPYAVVFHGWTMPFGLQAVNKRAVRLSSHGPLFLPAESNLRLLL